MLRSISARGVGIVATAPNHPSHHDIQLVHHLDDGQFERYQRAVADLTRVGRHEQIILVERNYRRLMAVGSFYANALETGQRDTALRARDAVSYLASDLLNWLTSTRLFLEHFRTEFSRLYGRQSSELANLRTRISHEYDASPAYRMLYKLRDYTQHCGLPVDAVRLALTNVSSPSSRSQINFLLNRDQLLSNFDWKAQVTRDLEKMPEEIDLLPLISDAAPCFRRIYGEVLRTRSDHAMAAVPVVREAASMVADYSGEPNLIEFGEHDEMEGVRNINLKAIPVDFATMISDTSNVDRVIDRLNTGAATLAGVSNRALTEDLSDDERTHIMIGAKLMSVFIEENGLSANFADAVNALIEEHDDIVPAVNGITYIAMIGLAMAGASVGTTPEDILGRILDRTDSPTAAGHGDVP